MFLDEARLAARIHHPNVVSILEVGTSEEGYYLVMEYIEGDTAARLVGRTSQAGGLPAGDRGADRPRHAVGSARRPRAHGRRWQAAPDRAPRRVAAEHPRGHRRRVAHHGFRRRARGDPSLEHADGAAQREARVHGSGTSARGRCRSPGGRVRDGSRALGASRRQAALQGVERRRDAAPDPLRAAPDAARLGRRRAGRSRRRLHARARARPGGAVPVGGGVRGRARARRAFARHARRRPGRSPRTWTARSARRSRSSARS